MDSSKLVFSFDEADPSDPNLFGGKGAGLSELVEAGYPVPSGFIISTAACGDFLQTGSLSEELRSQVEDHIGALERATSSSFRGLTEPSEDAGPLLVSVRSGRPCRCPG